MQNLAEKIFSVKTFDYNRAEPCIVRETAHWAVVYKPPHLPTAPLRADERNTLVYWFLQSPEAEVSFDDMQIDALLDATQIDAREPPSEYGRDIQEVQVDNKPEIRSAGRRIREAQVRGKKAIEAGLLHRLDTDTRGLVLFAKDQAVYDFLAARQEAGQIIKTYYAFVSPDTAETVAKTMRSLPYTVISQFRNFGPGAKRVAPVFPGSRHYKKGERLYTTVIEAVDMLPSLIGGNDTVAQIACESCPSQTGAERRLIRVRCRLSRGYRHQVRVHLAALGLPIVGDPLYAPQGAEAAHEAENTGVSLQLYAVSLAFPDPENHRKSIRIALPPPDKMNP